MFDDRLVFESPGKLPGLVKPTNIRNTHFSRNPKIAAFLKAYHYVKEYGEGIDRIYRELEANGSSAPVFSDDNDFILRISVPKTNEKLTEKGQKFTERLTENLDEVTEKLVKRAKERGDRLTQNRILILRLMAEDPYITKVELAKAVGISETAIMRNINILRGVHVRRVGPDKGGFWEIIE